MNERMRDEIQQLVMARLASTQQTTQLSLEEMQQITRNLHPLDEAEIISLGHKESVCPICFTSLLALVAQEEMALAMDSPAHPVEELGVTRLAKPWQCGHIFCRRDISRWVAEGHSSCPMCRGTLLPALTSQEASSTTAPAPAPLTVDYLDETELQNFIRDVPPGQGLFLENDLFSLLGGRAPESRRQDRSEYNGMYS
ncbi:hypothetical protein C8J56DRAFT_552958 [Mycena floridula]|nr:hypothetical protein C8J56DRAFT_552958 [Mycena floridula]